MKKLLIFLLLLTPLCSEAQFSIRNVGFLGALRGHRAAKLATPSGLSVTVGDGTAELSWTAVANADAYTFYISTNADFTGASFGGTATNSKHLSGLTNGVTYYWKVRASGAGFTASAYAVGASFTPAAGGAGPSLLFASIDDSLKNYIALHYSAALDNTSLPAAHDFALATNSTHFVVGELAKPYAVESPASTVLPIANTGGWGSSLASYAFINISHRSRIRYNDTVTKIRLWIGNIDDSLIAGIKVEFWRPNGPSATGSFHRTYSIPIAVNSLVPNSINTITLPSYAIVKEDDRVGMSVTATSYVHGSIFATEAADHTGSGIYPTGMYWQGTTSATDATWGNALYADVYVPIMCITKNAPLIMHIGDSNVEGYPTNTSDYNVDVVGASGITESFHTTVSFKLGVRLNCNVVNSGVSGQQADATRARFGQVIQSNVKYVIIGATTNGTGAGHDYLTDYVKMVDTAVAAGIVTFVNSVQPATSSDSWARAMNHALDSAVTLHGGHFVNTWLQLADTNTNLLLVKYQSDGIHINSAGMDVVAQIDADSIARYTPVKIIGSNVYVRANRPFSSTDKEYISYTVDGNPIRTGVGANASAFTSDTVTNNLTLAPEDLYYDGGLSWGETAPQVWGGTVGRADKMMPNTGVSWIGIMPAFQNQGVASGFLLADSLNAINNFDPNTFYSFSFLGWSQSGNEIWPIDQGNAYGQNQIHTIIIDSFKYWSIYREGVDFYVAGSNDEMNWVKQYHYVRKSVKPLYVFAYAYSAYPAGYNLVPIGSPDNIAPTIKSVSIPAKNIALLESDEKITGSTAGWSAFNVTQNSALTITAWDDVPSQQLRFYYQLKFSQNVLATDSVTVSYNPSTGSTTDTSALHNELAAFTKGAIKAIPTYAGYGASVPISDTFISSNQLHTFGGLLTTNTVNGTLGTGVYKYHVASTDDAVVIIDPKPGDFVYVTIKARNNTYPVVTDSIGYGYGFGNNTIYRVYPGGGAQVGVGGGDYAHYIYFARSQGQIYERLPDGGTGWNTWDNFYYSSYLQNLDWDVVITVGSGYARYPWIYGVTP